MTTVSENCFECFLVSLLYLYLEDQRWPGSGHIGGPPLATTGGPLAFCPVARQRTTGGQPPAATGGPLSCHRWSTRSGQIAGPLSCHRTKRQWTAGGCQRRTTHVAATGPPLVLQVFAIWVIQ